MLTEQNKLDISFLYLQKGLNRTNIAKELNLTEWSIRTFLKENNLKKLKELNIQQGILTKKYNPLKDYKKKSYELTLIDKETIINMYKNNISCINIHKQLKIPENIVYSYVKNTLGLRTQKEININTAYILNNVEKENIKQLYMNKNPLEISNELNIPKSVVFEYIKKQNLYKIKLQHKKHKIKSTVIKMYIEDKMSLNAICRTKLSNQKTISSILKEFNINRTFKESMDNFKNQKSYNLQNYDFFHIIDNELKAYWLGFIYADGNINKNISKLSIGLKLSDKEHLDKFSGLFNKKSTIYKQKSYKTIPDRFTCSLRVTTPQGKPMWLLGFITNDYPENLIQFSIYLNLHLNLC